MGPPVGSRTSDSRTPRTDTDSKPAHETGAGQPGNSPHSGSKRSAQHAQYHNAETKRRKEGAERAANIQQHATQLVQQLAAPDGDSIPQETSGTLAKAEDRQNAYNVSIDSKPWASGRHKVSHSVNPTAGLPMQTGHYSDTDTSSVQPSAHASSDAAAEGSPVEQTNSEPLSEHGEGGQENKKHSEAAEGSPVEQPSSEPSSDHGEGDQEGKKHSEAGSQSPSISDGANFSSTQKFKHGDGQSNPDMAAIKDRQIDEQTHQNHPQNCTESESGKRYLTSYCLADLHHVSFTTHSAFCFALRLEHYCTSGEAKFLSCMSCW